MNYLEMLPVSSIAKYTKGHPGDGIPFTGYPRANPSEKDKIILVNDPLGPEPVVLEFKLDDILFVEEIPSAVTKAGEGVPLVKLWIKRGSAGMIIEPFEVNEVNNPVQLAGRVQAIKERISQAASHAAPQTASQAAP
jgi:inorganic pyrophosphatase